MKPFDDDDEFEPVNGGRANRPIQHPRRVDRQGDPPETPDHAASRLADRLRMQREQRQGREPAPEPKAEESSIPPMPEPARASGMRMQQPPEPTPSRAVEPAPAPARLVSAARARDKMADPKDRVQAQNQLIVPRGFVTVEGARKAQKPLWIAAGLAGFVNALVTTILGVARVWVIVNENPTAPIVAYVLGVGFGLLFIAGSVTLAPSIYDRMKQRQPVDLAELCLYVLCALPDIVFTGLFHWFVWIMPFMVKVFSNMLLGLIIGLVLVGVIAVASSVLPLLAVLKNDPVGPKA